MNPIALLLIEVLIGALTFAIALPWLHRWLQRPQFAPPNWLPMFDTDFLFERWRLEDDDPRCQQVRAVATRVGVSVRHVYLETSMRLEARATWKGDVVLPSRVARAFPDHRLDVLIAPALAQIKHRHWQRIARTMLFLVGSYVALATLTFLLCVHTGLPVAVLMPFFVFIPHLLPRAFGLWKNIRREVAEMTLSVAQDPALAEETLELVRQMGGGADRIQDVLRLRQGGTAI